MAAFLLTALAVRATSVTPPSFTELVAEAQVIAEGTVTGISSQWVDGAQGRVIKTFVTFSVQKTLKGAATNPMALQFLGGTVGPDTLHVSGMPEFKVGETEILFISGNGVQFCPLVRFMHGRYHVRTNASSHRSYVTRDDDTPLGSTADVSIPEGDSHAAKALHSAATALTPEDFETEVSAEVKRRSR